MKTYKHSDCPNCGHEIDRATVKSLRFTCPNCKCELLVTFKYNVTYTILAVLAGVLAGYSQGLGNIALAGASVIYGAVILFAIRAVALALGMPLVLKRWPAFIQTLKQ